MHEVFQLPGTAIDGSDVCCLGTQLARVVAAISQIRGDLEWYAADVDPYHGVFPMDGSEPVLVGSSARLMEQLSNVSQFLRGVFLAVEEGSAAPRFRNDIDTEDALDADLGDAVIEVRAFDSTYIEIHNCDATVSEQISRIFGVAPLGHTPVA